MFRRFIVVLLLAAAPALALAQRPSPAPQSVVVTADRMIDVPAGLGAWGAAARRSRFAGADELTAMLRCRAPCRARPRSMMPHAGVLDGDRGAMRY
jgi:hypothetical protein